MNVYIDIGNSSTVFSFSKKQGNHSVFRVDTSLIFKEKLLKKKLLTWLEDKRTPTSDVKSLVICSVFPRAEKELKKQARIILPKTSIYICGKDLLIPVKNKYRYPEQVGNDRLVNAVAAGAYYKLPVLIVDFGTAITIDAVSAKYEYLGGVIVPGINLSLLSLHQKTALLPLLKAQKPKRVLAKDTKNSILSGIFYGYAFLVDGLIDALKKEIGIKGKRKFTVVATGGHLYLMKGLCHKIDEYDPDLTVKGIEKTYLSMK